MTLKPCPFCGGEAERLNNGPTKEQMAHALSWGGDADDGGSFIHCKRCDASTALHFDRRENLESSWNDRKDLSERLAEVEAELKSLIAAWENPGSMGSIYTMRRAVSSAKTCLEKNGALS
jgi:Lar family restriction alleviation protein